MPEIHLKQPAFIVVLVDYLLETKKEFKSLKRQEVKNLFAKMNKIKVVFNMICLMEIFKI